MANEKNLLDFPTTTSAESADWVHIQQGGVDKKISLADFIAELNGGNPFNITVREESGDNRILTIADKNAYIRCLNAVQTTIQVKNAQTVGWKKGDSIVFRKEGLGNVLMAADSGVTIRSAASGLSLTEVGQAGQLICVDDTPTATIFDFVTGGNARATVTGSITFLTVDGMKAGATNDGLTVDFAELAANSALVETIYNNTISKKGGAKYIIKTAAQVATDGDVIDGSGNHWLLGDTNFAAIIDVTNGFNLFQFGAVADATGSFDNKAVIDAVIDRLKDPVYPSFQGGVLEFEGGYNMCYGTSGLHDLGEFNVNFNNCKIRPIGNPDYVFKLNLRHTTNTRRFCKNWDFGNVTVYSSRGFGVSTQAVDFGSFLLIDGGWLIRSQIHHIDVDPGVAANALVKWDLTHPDLGSGVTEVGVPDGIVFDAISGQGAENLSFALAFVGDDLGTGSRVSSVTIKDIYNTITYPRDFEDRSSSTDLYGTVFVSNFGISRGIINEVFGGTNLFRVNGTGRVSNMEVTSIYGELNNDRSPDFQCLIRGGAWDECVFKRIGMFTLNGNLSASPRCFDDSAVFTNCEFYKWRFDFGSLVTSPPNSDLIKLSASSIENTFHDKPNFVDNPEDPEMPWILDKMTLPYDNHIKFIEHKRVSIPSRNVDVTANGTIQIASIASHATNSNDVVRLTCTIRAESGTTANINVRVAGGGIGSAQSSNTIAISSAEPARHELVYASKCTLSVAPDMFQDEAEYTFSTLQPSSQLVKADDNLTIQGRSGSVDFEIVTAGFSGSTIRVTNIELWHGQSDEYVNYI